MILVIDNYDSFVYNLVQYLGEMGEELVVMRNDELSLGMIKKLRPDSILLSPGPGKPEDAGICRDVIKEFYSMIPILGVCLGHQCIASVFNGKVVRAKRIMHGKVSMVSHDGKRIFKGLKNPFEATRYHSLIVERESLPSCLEITAWTERGEIMGVRHKRHNVSGVQFHPESILTSGGKKMLANFIEGRKRDI